MKLHPLQHGILAALFAIAITIWAGGAVGMLNDLLSGHQAARLPFNFGYRYRVVSGIEPEGVRAGVQLLKDSLEEVNGEYFASMETLRAAVRRMKPGDLLTCLIRHQDGSPAQVTVVLAAAREGPAPLHEWILGIVLNLILPLASILLGAWVVAMRPLDRSAWALLLIMFGIGSQVDVEVWEGLPHALVLAWVVILQSSVALGMGLFGLWFPEPFQLERRKPWIKWILIGPLLAATLQTTIFTFGKYWSFDSILWLQPSLMPLMGARVVLQMAAISLFCAALGRKSGAATNPDARRRLKIVWVGTSIGLFPQLIMAVAGLIRGSDFGYGFPEWFKILSGITFILCPASLAYAVVAHRAMELRMVFRQSAKYAFARGGLRMVRIVAVIVAVLLITRVFANSKIRTVDRVAAVAVASLLLIVRRKYSDRAASWMDRRFFREAYDAEQVLSDLTQQARKFIEAKPLLETVVQRISGTLHVPKISVLLRAEGTYRVEQATADDLRGVELQPEAESIRWLRAQDKPALIYFDDPSSWLQQAGAQEQETLRRLDSQLLLPLTGRDELVGVMVLGPKQSEEPYSATDLRLLQSVAAQTGLAIENSRLIASLANAAAQRERLNRELEIARDVQQRLFPQKMPAVDGVEIAGKCRPAQDVGGDYYDFLALPGGKLGIAIGDVAGKGISAALLMASLRASLRGQTMNAVTDIATMIANVNLLVYESSAKNRFATLFYAQYCPVTRRLDYVNAGHNSPFVLRGDILLRFETCGPALGLVSKMNYRQCSLTLEPGDLLIGFTDGFSEAMTPSNEEFGEERLAASARCWISEPPAEIMHRLLAAVDEFTHGAEQHDDMTLVVLRAH